MKYCFYRMTVDSGFAPNPYYGWCTLATCTPNHMRANLEEGDVIVGVEANSLIKDRQSSAMSTGPRVRCIVYHMTICDVLSLDEYFHDPRFAAKKADPQSRSYAKRHGDNVYWRAGSGFTFTPNNQHDDPRVRQQDIEGDRVYIGKEFFYFGDKYVKLPPQYEKHVPTNYGIKYCHSPLPGLDSYVKRQAALRGRSGRIGAPISKQTSESCKISDQKSVRSIC